MSIPSSDIAGLIPHRACRNCVQIKTRCIPHADSTVSSSVCERCYRLGKICSTPAPAIRKRRRETSTKVAQLEERIKHLSNLITPQSTPSDTNNDILTSNTVHQVEEASGSMVKNANTCSSHPTVSTSRSLDQMQLTSSEGEGEISKVPFPCTSMHQNEVRLSTVIGVPHLAAVKENEVVPADFCPMYLDADLEEKLMQRYHEKMKTSFPFVVISASKNTAALKKEKPFVFWAICASASFYDRALHIRLNSEFLKHLGDQMLYKGHKSLDVLQGILLLISWYHFYGHVNPQLINLMRLAQALVIDLGLNRPSCGRSRTRLATDLADLYHGRRMATGLSTNDDRRALLGVFYFTARMAQCFGRIEPMRFTQHMQQCCEELEAAQELPSDIFLVHLVRLHQLVGRYTDFDATTTRHTAPFLTSSLSSDLQTFQRQLPQSLKHSREMSLELYSCKFCVLGPNYFGDYEDTVEATEALYASHAAIKDFTECAAAYLPEEFLFIISPFWWSMTAAMGTLGESCFLNMERWDLRLVREKLSFGTASRHYYDLLTSVQSYAAERSWTDLAARFELYCSKMERCIKWYDAKIKAEALAESQRASNDPTTDTYSFAANMFEMFDDRIWDEVMADWSVFSAAL